MFQILSDVHLELNASAPSVTPMAPYLCLLGDIGDPFDIKYSNFIRYCAGLFERVFVIAGNHEFYENDYHDTLEQIERVCAGVPQAVFLNNSTYTLTHEGTEITICGTILWSNVSELAFNRMNDGNYIVYDGVCLTRGRYLALHRECVEFIERTIASATDTDTLVVLSHHAPHPVMCGKYQGNALSSGFASDLTRLLRTPVRAWLSGHTHQSLTVDIGSVRLMSNCYGYDSERTEASAANVALFTVAEK